MKDDTVELGHSALEDKSDAARQQEFCVLQLSTCPAFLPELIPEMPKPKDDGVPGK